MNLVPFTVPAGAEIVAQKRFYDEPRPQYFDFDMNKHVTSSRYIDWMMDSLSMEFHKNNYPTELSINFLKEVLPNESVTVFSKPQDGFHLFSGVNRDSGTAYFSGQITF